MNNNKNYFIGTFSIVSFEHNVEKHIATLKNITLQKDKKL